MTAGEDSVADHQGTPLAGHLDAYLLRLEAEGTSPAHRINVRRCLDRLGTDCGFARLADLQRERLERWLVSQSKTGMGARTRNTYRAAAVAFGNWCVKGAMTPLSCHRQPRIRSRCTPMGRCEGRGQAFGVRFLPFCGAILARSQPI